MSNDQFHLHQLATEAMEKLFQKIVRFLKADEGPTAVEYAVMLMLILLSFLSVITVVGSSASSSFTDSKDSIEKAIN